MPVADEFQQPSRGTFTWHSYDSSVKAELWSTALTVPTGLYFIDPIGLVEPVLGELCRGRSAAGIIVTNANHFRAAAEYAAKFSIPIFTGADTSVRINPDLETITIEGAVADEIALFQPSTGTLMVGDALINFEPQGFTFLPKKYCIDEKKMRRSLRQLLTLKIERILFAHGEPILAGAAEKVRALFDS